ncbi:MAG: dihydroorotate dehydrogenase electron transfer subunit [Ruminococcaceae bacterium]|nr:dihydroorotate dehydrogenase electron transfer subunit [Oscillospiraceae bacterium]
MKQVIFKIASNLPLTETVYRMELVGDSEGITCGQFVNIKIDGLFLRRPISVYDVSTDSLTIVYKVVGQGTEKLCEMKKGDELDILTCLGNGYSLDFEGENALLIGGGVGVPPLYYLAKQLLKKGKKVSAILGFNTKAEVFGEEDFKALGVDVTVTTADGSYGIKGFVTDALPEYDYYYFTCGPEPMLKAVYKNAKGDGQFSFEERMGCGFGACMGCSHKTVKGYKRVCKDGPVFKKEEILWED